MATDYRWSSMTASDVAAWARLSRVLADAAGTEEHYTAEDLAEELTEHGVDPERDTWAVWDGPRLVAFGQVRVSEELDDEGEAHAHLDGVHPEHRGRGLGRQLMELAENRAIVLARGRHPGAPLRLGVPGGQDDDPKRPMLERRGYAIARYFHQMRRPLPGEPVTEPALPPGVRLVTVAERWREPLRLARNDAFRDHWGNVPVPAESWADHFSTRAARWDASVVAADDSDRVLSYVRSFQWVDRELYVGSVGTIRAARGQGLAEACLARVLRLAGADGRYDHADLHVDSVSPTGATRLYERLGWSVLRTTAAYQRTVT